MPVIGLIDQRSPEALAANRLRGFRQGLRDAGLVDGQNAAIEYRWTENKADRLQALMQSILVLLPAWMTENSAATLPMVAAPRLSLDALRELRGLIDAQRLSSSPSSETNRMGGGDDGTTCRMAIARSPGARNKRKPAPATRSDDSLAGHGSAQTSSQRMQRRPRNGEGGGR